MASKSKAPAKKPASKNAPRSRPKKPAQIRTAAKKPAHPAKSKPKSAKSTKVAKVAKVAKVTKVTKVTKPAAGRGAKPLKGAPPAHKVPSKKPLPRGSARSGKAASTVISVASVTSEMPPAKPLAQRPQVVLDPKDVAAAHEYLLSRSANRSNEPIMFNGRRLPSEEQLLKMADADYMNDAQLAFFKYRLQEMERELLANAGETTEHLRETVIVPDPADRATIEEEHALELRTRDRERKLLKKVQDSLARIEAGDYGFCEETGDPIGIPRLIARPTATLSLEAQQRREMKQRLYGD
jgi:DnaK suppressor protein